MTAADFVWPEPYWVVLIASLNKSSREAQWRAHIWNVKEAAMQKAFNESAPMPQSGGEGDAEAWR